VIPMTVNFAVLLVANALLMETVVNVFMVQL